MEQLTFTTTFHGRATSPAAWHVCLVRGVFRDGSGRQGTLTTGNKHNWPPAVVST